MRRDVEAGGDDPASPSNGVSTSRHFIQRRGQPSSSTGAPTSATPILPHSLSPRQHSSTLTSCCASFCNHPYYPIITTLLLFALFIFLMSYVFAYLTSGHPSHQFSLDPTSSADLLLSPPTRPTSPSPSASPTSTSPSSPSPDSR